jgi:hypothetical protein
VVELVETRSVSVVELVEPSMISTSSISEWDDRLDQWVGRRISVG